MPNGDTIEVQLETLGSAVVLRPIGDVDLSRASELRMLLTSALGPAPARLILDLREVPYMDSSGVATFVEAMQLSRKRGSRLVLCNLQPRVLSIIEIARLDTVFTIREDIDAALTA